MSLITMNITFSILFVFMNHPLSLGLIILIQTALISLISGQFCLNFWFSYILFLIMIGGMLILFIYMTSIASNEKFLVNFNGLILFTMMTVISIILLFIETPFTDQSMKNDMLNLKETTLVFSMIKYTSLPQSLLLLFMIIYLFITLIAIVKIIDNKQGPLRPKN